MQVNTESSASSTIICIDVIAHQIFYDLLYLFQAEMKYVASQGSNLILHCFCTPIRTLKIYIALSENI